MLIIAPGSLSPYQDDEQSLQIRYLRPRRPQAGLRAVGWKAEKQSEQCVLAVSRRETRCFSVDMSDVVFRISFPSHFREASAVGKICI